MSKSVRIRDHLYAEIERLAAQERRSLISQLEVLLEQALGMSDTLTIRDGAGNIIDHISPTRGRDLKPTVADAQPRDIPARTVSPDAHFKPDFK